MIKSFIKKMLGQRALEDLYELRIRFKRYYNNTIASNIFFIWLDSVYNSYYLRENMAVRSGMKKYFDTQYKTKNNIYLLRRNIHRIEKGLLMRPRRKEFALSFILETVILFENVNFTGEIELKIWASDVLNEYFNISISSDDRYIKSKNKFTTLINTIYNDNVQKKVPYKRKDHGNVIKPESFIRFLEYRKSVRWFDQNKTVSKEIIETAIKAASLAPSSCNRQPYTYYIANNKDQAIRLAKISPGTVGWADNITNLAVVVGKLSAFGNIVNRHSIYVDATLSVMPFLLQLEANGVASCLINWSDIKQNEQQMMRILNLENDERVVLSIAFGYEDKDGYVAFSQRKNNKGILRYV